MYSFGAGKADGRAQMDDALGGKGANLAEMTLLGIPVPPGFTISTEVCREFNRKGGVVPRRVKAAIVAAIAKLENTIGARFGDPEDPLLLSVRSGARASMPGMMDSVLNLGLTRQSVLGLAARANERFAYDSYRRLIQMYGDVVLNVSRDRFEMRIDDMKHAKGIHLDTELDAGILEDDPFVSVDEEGIGELVKMGAKKGRSTKANLKLGICGEHGGDPKSVKFFARIGLDYVSCSPFRVPAARLAAAQAAIEASTG